MPDPERVSVTVDDGVAEVRLLRADKRNALDRRMLRAVIEAGEQLVADRSVRAVVLSAAGASFCAGLDTALFAALAEAQGRGTGSGRDTTAIREDGVRAVRVWVGLEVPVIAAVHGAAVGGGLQIALGADFRVVAPDAQLGALEIRWGLVPDMCGTQLLPRLVGPAVAKELMMTGRIVTGTEAHALGLATHVADDPRRAALDLARQIADRNPDAVRIVKRLVDDSWSLSFDDGVARERDRTEGLVGSPNQREALLANLEQRPARFDA
jgi:enoyl-CoA hydratase/carnithine racemase